MKFSIYVTSHGCEQLALDKPLYEWHYGLKIVTTDDSALAPDDGMHIGFAECPVLSKESARSVAEKALKAKLQAHYVEAEKEQRELKERIQNLLALPAPQAQVLTERELSGVDYDPVPTSSQSIREIFSGRAPQTPIDDIFF